MNESEEGGHDVTSWQNFMLPCCLHSTGEPTHLCLSCPFCWCIVSGQTVD